MKILPPLKSFTLKQWFLMLSTIFGTYLLMQFHFILEFAVIMKHGLPYFFVIFHYLGLSIGSVLGIKIIYKKLPHFVSYILFMSIMTFFFIIMIIIDVYWIVPIGLLGAGTCIGVIFGLLYEHFHPLFENPKYAARFFSTAFIFISIFLFLEAFIDINVNPTMGAIFISIIYVLAIICALLGKEAFKDMPIQESIKIKEYFKKKENLLKIGFAFFWGFFWINTYYITVLFLDLNNLETSLNSFVATFAITIAIFSFPSGLLADIIGRRITILFGLMIQSLAFLVLSILPQNNMILLFIFPIVLGIGFSLNLSIGLVNFGELPARKYMRDNNALFFIFIGFGMLSGVFLGYILQPLFSEEPAYLTLILLFIFMCATVVIFQLKETLPPKEELEWKNSIQYLYVIDKSGITLYSQDLCELQNEKKRCDEYLIGGALSAISSLMKEILNDQSPLKIVKQEGFSLLIEEGKEVYVVIIALQELKSIRKKMIRFREEFEDFFEDLLDDKIHDIKAFSPTKKLVNNYFS